MCPPLGHCAFLGSLLEGPWPCPQIPLPVILGAMFKETAAETTEPQEVLVLRNLNGEACFLVTGTLEAYLPTKMSSFPTVVTHTLT